MNTADFQDIPQSKSVSLKIGLFPQRLLILGLSALASSLQYMSLPLLWGLSQRQVLSTDYLLSLQSMASLVSAWYMGETIGIAFQSYLEISEKIVLEKISLVFSMATGIIGSIMFGIGCCQSGEDIQKSIVNDGFQMLFWGRLLQGIYSGSQFSILNKSVRETTPKNEISLMQSYMQGSSIIGMICAPLFGFLLTRNLWDFTLIFIRFNQFTMISIAQIFLLGFGILFTYLRYAYLDKIKQDSEFYKSGVKMATSMVVFQDEEEEDEEQAIEIPQFEQQDPNIRLTYVLLKKTKPKKRTTVHDQFKHMDFYSDQELRMISKKAPSKFGLFIVLLIIYANVDGFTIFESFIGPIIQYQGVYIRDSTDLNCTYVYVLYTTFGFASLMGVIMQAKFEASRGQQKFIKALGPRSQVLACLGLGLFATLIMTSTPVTQFQIMVGFTFLHISYILCQVAIYSMFFRITGRHNIKYLAGYLIATSLLRTMIPIGIAARLELDSADIMIAAWIKYIIAILAVILGKNKIAPHEMWEIEKKREKTLENLKSQVTLNYEIDALKQADDYDNVQ